MRKTVLVISLLISVKILCQTISFKLLPTGHIVVPAKVQGIDGNFILDTGAGINLLFEDFAQKLPRKPQSYNFFTGFRATGERLDVPLYKDIEMDLVGINFTDIPFSIANLKIEGIDGLISLKMFENTDILLDYERQEIILDKFHFSNKTKAIDIFISTQADDSVDIFTYALLNDKHKIKVLLDTGAGRDSYWLNDKFINTLGLNIASLQNFDKVSETNETIKTKIYTTKINSISNEFSKIEHPNIMFVENLIYEGKTSLNWLGERIVISIRNKKIYILD